MLLSFQKTLLRAAVCLLTVQQSQAQSTYLSAPEEIAVGATAPDSTPIVGRVVTFAERIFRYEVDSASGLLTLQLRATSKDGARYKPGGELVQYDPAEARALWTRHMTYPDNSVLQSGSTILFANGMKTHLLDPATGEERWWVAKDMYVLKPERGLGLGYRMPGARSKVRDNLQAVDLSDGSVRWEREVNRDYGWNEIYGASDSTVLLVSSGLHEIDLGTGEGWSYGAATGTKDYTGSVVTSVLGVAAGILTGTYALGGSPEVVRGAVSNVLADSSGYFLASRDEIVRLDPESGEVQWRTPLPEKTGSASTLALSDSAVYMLNYGKAYLGYRTIDFGRPFLAAFGRGRGERRYLRTLGDKGELVLAAQAEGDRLRLVFADQVSDYDRVAGELVREWPIDRERYGEFRYLIGSQVYVERPAGKFVSLTEIDSTRTYLYLGKEELGTFVGLDAGLAVVDEVEESTTCIRYGYTPEHTFLQCGEATTIVDRTGTPVATLEVKSDAVLVGDTLYAPREKSLIIVNLKTVLSR